MIGGYVKVDPLTGVDRFPQNHRVRQVRWTFSDGTTVTQDLADSRNMQTIPVDVTTTTATMEILATYPPGGRSATRHGARRRGAVHRRVSRLASSAVLAVVGDLLEDIVVRIATTPALGTDTPARIERRRGGSAANVAACAARAGAAVRFIGCVGADELGERLVGDLAADGVDVRVQRRGRTGSVVVLVGPDGERTMLPDRAAATELADVDAAWLDGVTWLHVPSYSLLSEPIGAAVRAMIVALRRAGGRLSVDVSSVAVVEPVRRRALRRRCSASWRPTSCSPTSPESRLLPTSATSLTIVKDGPRPVRVRGSVEGSWRSTCRRCRTSPTRPGPGTRSPLGTWPRRSAATRSQAVQPGSSSPARVLRR